MSSPALQKEICSSPTTNYPIHEFDPRHSRMAYAIREWEALAPIPDWHMLFVNGRGASQEYTLRPPIHEWHMLVGNSIT
jgi:hypothetical protein